jgi:hypothetical protein
MLVTNAVELMDSRLAPLAPLEARTGPSIASDGPWSYLIPTKFLDDLKRFPYAPRRDTSPQREAYYLEG